jgi:hypothetical protein
LNPIIRVQFSVCPFLDHLGALLAPNPSLRAKTSSARRCELITDSAAGLNSEKSTNLTFSFLPDICTIYNAYSLVRPPITEGADTPGIHLLFITSTSNDTNIAYAFSLSRFNNESKSCPACVRHCPLRSVLYLRISFSIQITSAPLDWRYSK